ncbi:MAG: type II toxin-antitoxin system RelE/ParE family toxin [Melioribacteraceae bacterium]|nr:type II toxin-antitoxin system RelE/ParE family toxin [Melioribacteraceae bacterium]MCF8394414.1 type II toxin-antitoxin system RelE/ParE family toxin [Melioribacteraceae bacterium]MCF8417490.1 type II toxin-antitoxin system RelE/ParE family toxin [Melioribacteraceae bacterium]
MDKKRQLIYFREYFWDFFNKQKEKTKDKIDYVLFLVTVADKIPKKFFEPMAGYDRLFAIGIKFESNIYRIFCCFDKGNLVVLFNGFQKKTQKTPKKEIEKAMRIMKEYFDYKQKGDKNERYNDI